MNNLDKALRVASWGWSVLPVAEDKKAMYRNWETMASSDPVQVERWWTANPRALVGVHAGLSGLIVGDIDMSADPESGKDGWSSLIEADIDPVETWNYGTRSGGEHYVYAANGVEVGPAAHILTPGGIKLQDVDRRAGNGYFVLWTDDLPEACPELAPVPEWLTRPNSIETGVGFQGTLDEWFETMPPGPPSYAVQMVMDAMPRGEFGHPEMIKIQRTLIGLAVDGHPGVQDALTLLANEYTRPPYDTAHYVADFTKGMVGAIRKYGEEQKVEAERVEFWERRPVLSHCLTTARQSVLSPWALLGALMQRAVLDIPYTVPYKSALGTVSINTLYAFVGKTGGGKSRTHRVLDDAFSMRGDAWRASVKEPGSGEGLIDAYRQKVKNEDGHLVLEWTTVNHALMFGFDEVGSLTGRQARQGTTIFEVMKTAESGGALSRVLARGEGTELPAKEYRFCLFVNVQPAKAGDLFDDSAVAGGLPGRFLWLSTVAADARSQYLPGPVTKYVVPSPHWDPKVSINALPEMDAEHLESQFAAHEGTRDELDSHSSLTRAKVAIALAVLDGRAVLNAEDWELSGLVMEHSDETRSSVQSALAEAAKLELHRQGKAQGTRNAVSKSIEHEHAVKRVADLIRKHRAAGKAELGKGGVRASLRSEDRKLYYAEACELLAKAD